MQVRPGVAGPLANDSTQLVGLLQDEISRAIVNKLRLTLGRGQRRYDTDLDAYDLYLKARTLIARRGVANAQQAADLFEQVVARDPGFAPAHAGLALAYAFMSMPYAGLHFEAAYPIMRPAAINALQLDPLLAEAHAAMGWVYAYERDWANAERAFQRAIELNPSLTHLYTSYSISTLEPLGKPDEALRLLQVASRHDPLSLDVQREIGRMQVASGRYGDAIDTFQRVHAADPEFPFVREGLARALMGAGRVAQAFPLDPRSPWLAHAYVMTGRRAQAEELVAAHEGDPWGQAIIYAALGDNDRAFEALERVAISGPQRLGRLLNAPEMRCFGATLALRYFAGNSACRRHDVNPGRDEPSTAADRRHSRPVRISPRKRLLRDCPHACP